MTFEKFWTEVYPLILNHTIDKFEKTFEDGTKVKAYWVVNVIRIDITPGS